MIPDLEAGRNPRTAAPANGSAVRRPGARVVAVLALLAAALGGTACHDSSGAVSSRDAAVEVPRGRALAEAVKKLETQVAGEEAKARKILAKVQRFAAKGTYIVVDTGTNRLYLMNGEQIVREAVVSTGSGSRLVDIQGKRVWVFNTPRGEFEIQRKVTNPVWTKPDWAFIEDGEPIPKNFSDRVDPDVLGDYAMMIGDGYMIHGSLYKRTLGMSVTHGCIRVGDDDLEVVFKASPVGTKVFVI